MRIHFAKIITAAIAAFLLSACGTTLQVGEGINIGDGILSPEELAIVIAIYGEYKESQEPDENLLVAQPTLADPAPAPVIVDKPKEPSIVEKTCAQMSAEEKAEHGNRCGSTPITQTNIIWKPVAESMEKGLVVLMPPQCPVEAVRLVDAAGNLIEQGRYHDAHGHNQGFHHTFFKRKGYEYPQEVYISGCGDLYMIPNQNRFCYKSAICQSGANRIDEQKLAKQQAGHH